MGLLLLAACGGGRATAPTAAVPSPAPTATPGPAQALDIRDGWTGALVPGVTASASPGQTVTVTAPGYLPRVQAFTAGQALFLWPQDETYVRAIVYGANAAGRLLTRWTRPSITITIPPGAETVAQEAGAEIARTTGLQIAFGPGGDVVVDVKPSDPLFSDGTGTLAATRLNTRAATILSVEVVCASDDIARGTNRIGNPNIILHELGHAVGLTPSISRDDVMFQGARTALGFRFSDAERIVLRMMYARRSPGNAPPDRDPSADAAGARERTIVVRD